MVVGRKFETTSTKGFLVETAEMTDKCRSGVSAWKWMAGQFEFAQEGEASQSRYRVRGKRLAAGSTGIRFIIVSTITVIENSLCGCRVQDRQLNA